MRWDSLSQTSPLCFMVSSVPSCADLAAASHLRREGQTTVDAGEADAAPGGLSTEVSPHRGTGENSSGQQ